MKGGGREEEREGGRKGREEKGRKTRRKEGRGKTEGTRQCLHAMVLQGGYHP